jgi:hypothetical protein
MRVFTSIESERSFSDSNPLFLRCCGVAREASAERRPVLGGGPAIPVRCGQLDRKVAERTCLTRQERTRPHLLVRENGGRATAVFHLPRDQPHLAGTATAASAAENHPRSGAQDCGQHGLIAATHDCVSERTKDDSVLPDRGHDLYYLFISHWSAAGAVVRIAVRPPSTATIAVE